MEYKGLAVMLKKQVNDIIDHAYKDKPDWFRRKAKWFTISCYDKELKSRLADYALDTAIIRIFALKTESYKSILITTMHEVSHHIEYIERGTTGHQKTFYEIHKKLLFAAMDMGLLTAKDVVNSDSNAGNVGKLGSMMKEYVPNPVAYKQDTIQIFVYKSFSIKDSLKERGYKWNQLDKAWVLETTSYNKDDEIGFLCDLQVHPTNITVLDGATVVSRLRKFVKVYDVPYEKRNIVKGMGYHWVKEEKIWGKSISGENIPREEREVLENMNCSIVIMN